MSSPPEDTIDQEQFYIQLIRELKTGTTRPEDVDLEKHQPSCELEELMEKIDDVNRQLCEATGAEFKPVAGVVEFYTGKGKAFDDPKYERLFDVASSASRNAKSTTKLLDYSFREKLSGFIGRRGGLQWEDGKISEFVTAIKDANDPSK